MNTYKTKDEAQKAANEIISLRDWSADDLTVTKAIPALNGVSGWIILDAFNQVFEV